MDDQDTVSLYGNATLPAATPDRPLVTFALFAYNQEQFIREAVAGALSQTYSPLEIILSDDCSSDRTFAIMEELAREYDGPHLVKVRRNAINLMTALHVQAVANEMQGDLMVVAAGDDVSLPHRVTRLVESWVQGARNPVVLHSHACLMTENGEILDEVARPRSRPGATVNLDWFLKEQINPILSPTAAYARVLFQGFASLIGGSLIEDGPLVTRGFLMGSFLAVEEALLIQRKVRNSSGTGYSCHDLPRWNRFVRSKVISSFNKLQDIPAGCAEPDQARLLAGRIRKDIRSLSKCVFAEHLSHSTFGRIWMAATIVLFYPASYRLRGRIGFALAFANLDGPSHFLKRLFPSKRSALQR